MIQKAVILPDLVTYQEQLSALEQAIGMTWQPQEGCTNGIDYAIVLPAGYENIIPSIYPRVTEYKDYYLVEPAVN